MTFWLRMSICDASMDCVSLGISNALAPMLSGVVAKTSTVGNSMVGGVDGAGADCATACEQDSVE